jgi:hypothetical protein
MPHVVIVLHPKLTGRAVDSFVDIVDTFHDSLLRVIDMANHT